MRKTQDWGVLAARAMLSALFIVAGFSKLANAAGLAGYLGSMGVPAPELAAHVLGAFEIAMGGVVLFGWQARAASLILAAFCIFTAIVGHVGPGELNSFLKNVGLAGGFLLLSIFGPGAYSLDQRRARRRPAKCRQANG